MADQVEKFCYGVQLLCLLWAIYSVADKLDKTNTNLAEIATILRSQVSTEPIGVPDVNSDTQVGLNTDQADPPKCPSGQGPLSYYTPQGKIEFACLPMTIKF